MKIEIPEWLKKIAERQSINEQAAIAEQENIDTSAEAQHLQKQRQIEATEDFINNQWERLNIGGIIKEVSTLFDHDQTPVYTNKNPRVKYPNTWPNVDDEIYKEQSITKNIEFGNGNADEHTFTSAQIFTIRLSNKKGLLIEYGKTSCSLTNNPESIENEEELRKILEVKLLETYNKEESRITEWKRIEKLPQDPRYGDRA